ncbi:MAG: hypothetical protein H0X66_05525 [Verrucomicrobia bacterium]|nr:hypothetical protein [Verrucomicrobiota bacterium]
MRRSSRCRRRLITGVASSNERTANDKRYGQSPNHNSQRTFRITDAAPMTTSLAHQRYRGVRCIRLVRRSQQNSHAKQTACDEHAKIQHDIDDEVRPEGNDGQTPMFMSVQPRRKPTGLDAPPQYLSSG